MALIESVLQELDGESRATRRLLERVPGDKLTWRPHPKARTLGELAWHVATVPGTVAAVVAQSPGRVGSLADSSPSKAAELVPLLDENLARARQLLADMDDATVTGPWKVVAGEQEIMALPRMAFMRMVLLNHWYHHRGQLSVYLRELGVPIPSIYGPSADEQPFAV